ncbi:hypothetical protein BDV12DRAFT_188621 [Aspergillus spectabilis]
MIPLTTRSLEGRALKSGSRQASVFGVGGAFVAFVTAVIAARIYARLVMLHAMGTDDIMSLLIFYLRLDPRRYVKWAVYYIMFIVMGVSIACFFILAFSCFPSTKFWDVAGTIKGRCMNANSQQAFYRANGILKILTDTFIYMFPIPMLWGVRISTPPIHHAAGGARYDFVRKLANKPDQYYYLADWLNSCSIQIYVAMASSHRHLKDTIELDGSEEKIISGRSRTEGMSIMMKTDIRMEFNDRDVSSPTESIPIKIKLALRPDEGNLEA